MPVATLRLITSRTARTASIVLIGLLFVLLLVYEAQHAGQLAAPHAAGVLWVWYATYAFIGALFFGVGALVWLYSSVTSLAGLRRAGGMPSAASTTALSVS